PSPRPSPRFSRASVPRRLGRTGCSRPNTRTSRIRRRTSVPIYSSSVSRMNDSTRGSCRSLAYRRGRLGKYHVMGDHSEIRSHKTNTCARSLEERRT
ncbi:hypothetical protein PENTCL1PPCAC_331, partial [Pristionchus entomophagus]